MFVRALRSLEISVAVAGALIVLATTLLVGISGYLSAKNELQLQISARAASESRQTMAAIDAYLAARKAEIGALAFRDLAIKGLTEKERFATLTDFINAFGRTRYADLSIVTRSGRVASASNLPDFNWKDPAQRALLSGTQAAISQVVLFRDQPRPMFAVHVPIADENGRIDAVLIARLTLGEIDAILQDVPLDAGSEIVLMQGNTTIGEVKGADFRPDARFLESGAAATGGVVPNLRVIVRTDAMMALAPVRVLAIRSVIAGFIALLLGALAAFWCARRVARPVKEAAAAARALADGDLDARLAIGRVPVLEIEQMAAAFNAMSDGVAQLVRDMEHASHDVDVAATKGLSVARDADSAASRQAEQVQNIATALTDVGKNIGALVAECDSLVSQSTDGLAAFERFAADVREATTASSQLRLIIEESNSAGRALTNQAKEVGERVDTCSRQAERADAAAADGGAAIDSLAADMRTVAERLVETVERLNTLAHSSGNAIRAQLSVVDDVSERSKLLALNAGIEAARAGASGRGFAVIADELHKLASHSKDASGRVGALVTQVLSEAEAVAAGSRDATALAEASIRRAGDTMSAFARVAGEIEKTTTAVGEIGAIAAQQARHAAQVEHAAARLNTVSAASGAAMARVEASSDAIALSVRAARDLADAVSASAGYQRSVHEEVLRSVGDIDVAARDVAAMARTSSRNGDALQREAHRLLSAVVAFRRASPPEIRQITPHAGHPPALDTAVGAA